MRDPNIFKHSNSPSITFPNHSRPTASPFSTMAAVDISKPIAFCEHLQLSSLGVQPASISFQVRRRVWSRWRVLTSSFVLVSACIL